MSIVIPAYNVERYIEECIRSVLDQLRDHHELIVVNDGSTDATLALATRLHGVWPGTNFRVLDQENQGIACARNRCIAAARGDYIAFVDSDDVLLDGSLAALDAAITAQRPDVIAFDFRLWHPIEPERTRVVTLAYPNGQMLRDVDTILATFLADRKMYMWAHVFKRSIYETLAAPVFPPGRVFEDIATLPRLLSRCATLVHVPHVMIDYRQHPASITHSVSEEWCQDFAAALPLARDSLRTRGVSDAVQRQFDLTATWFFHEAFKSTYRLRGRCAQRARAIVRTGFADSLFGDCATVLDTIKRRDAVSPGRSGEMRMIAQVQSALEGDVLFHVRLFISRTFKNWRQARKVRRHLELLALTG